MLSNETSTYLRAFPRRKAWYETFQHNYKRNRLTSFGTKRITITLWNLTKKYEGALKQKDIIPVKEAEIWAKVRSGQKQIASHRPELWKRPEPIILNVLFIIGSGNAVVTGDYP